jgi:hypothetical protein
MGGWQWFGLDLGVSVIQITILTCTSLPTQHRINKSNFNEEGPSLLGFVSRYI